MYKVLLVDDERLIREGLRELIDWPAHGFEVAAVAADGLEALEKLAEVSPHLVIADIRMPRMDGLELLETLRQRGDAVPFLVLSGFAEFEYAKRASALRIDGYLLKPVDEEELAARLAEVRRHLDATQWSVQALLEGADRVPEAYNWGRWQVALLAPLTAAGVPLTLDPEGERRWRSACTERGWGEAFVQAPLVGVLLKQVYPGGRNAERLARDILHLWEGEVPLFAGALGEVVTEPAGVAESYRQARAQLQRRFFSPPNTLVWPTPDPVAMALPDPEAASERLALALEAGQRTAVRHSLQAWVQAWASTGNEEVVKEGVSRVVSAAVERYVGHEARSSALRARTTSWIADVWRQPFLSTLVAFLGDQLDALLAQERGPDSAGLVQKMIDLIESRYAEPLKLESLADIFHYNSAYLGKLFRTKTGEYFNTYLDRVRIRHAQGLLREGLKVYQVAELVGYKYVDYFHAKFKKYTGVSPSQYRDPQANERG